MKLKSFENCFNEFFFLNQDQLVEEVDNLGLKDEWFFHHWQQILEQDAANKKFLVLRHFIEFRVRKGYDVVLYPVEQEYTWVVVIVDHTVRLVHSY